MSDDYENYIAKRGGAESAASIAYFDARLQIDTTQNQKIFRDGFERAYDLREKELTALRSQVAELERKLKLEEQECQFIHDKLTELQRQLDEAARQEPIAWTSTGQLKNAKKLEEGTFWLQFDKNFAEQAQEIGSKTIQIPLFARPVNLPSLIEQAKAEEREECAKVCEAIAKRYVGFGFFKVILDCVDAIRARKP